MIKHHVHAEPCEYGLRSALLRASPGIASYGPLEVKTLRKCLETLESYRSVIAVLKDQLAACQPQKTSSDCPADSTTPTQVGVSLESSQIRPLLASQNPATFPISSLPSGARPVRW